MGPGTGHIIGGREDEKEREREGGQEEEVGENGDGEK